MLRSLLLQTNFYTTSNVPTIMKAILIPIFTLFLFTVSVFAEDEVKTSIAKVDYGEIDDLLESVVLNVEGNKELRERYYAKKKQPRKPKRSCRRTY